MAYVTCCAPTSKANWMLKNRRAKRNEKETGEWVGNKCVEGEEKNKETV